MTLPALTRRQTLGALAATAAAAPVAAQPAALTAKRPLDEAGAKRLIDTATDHLLALAPESATSNNVDKGRYAPLRRRLSDRSQAG